MTSADHERLRKSRFVWIHDQANRRNQYVRFQRVLNIEDSPDTFPLLLFADTRYRLRVNEQFVSTGPARFVTQFPEYDLHDLAPFLQPGRNIICVDVNFFGSSSYQSMPDGEPGFIAAGGNAKEDLFTPGKWTATRLHAWRPDAPSFSFAQNPVEICDTRLLEQGAPAPLNICDDERSQRVRLTAYRGPRASFKQVRPKTIELVGALLDDEQILGFMSHNPFVASAQPGEQPERPWTAFATWIHSPRTQQAGLSVFWSELFLNGEKIHIEINQALGNHGRATLNLREGWNLLTGKVHVLLEYWAFPLGIPRNAGLSLHARQDTSAREPLSLAPVGTKESLILPRPGDVKPPPGWQTHSGDPLLLTPSRVMAWDRPGPNARRKLQAAHLPGVCSSEDHIATWCFSFEGEFMGHVALDVEAPPGAALDIAYDDWLRADGCAATYRAHPFTDTADRFILRGGRQQIECFQTRGGKLIQITLRAPESARPGKLALHDIWVRARQTMGEDATTFSTDHVTLQWAWPVALRTLRVASDESYTDCPWRERGCYIGDSLVSLHLHALFSPDLRIGARVIRQFAQAQLSDGQLPCCAPAWLRKPHEDFTLLWIIALHDYWCYTGDVGFLDEHWPVLQRIWDSPSWPLHASGLWNGTGRRLFIDWGAIPSEREGECNAVINLLRVAALRKCAIMAQARGKPDESLAHQENANRLERTLFDLLWSSAEGRLLASLDSSTPALHANALALAYGVGDRENRQAILAYLEPHLRANLANGLHRGKHSGHLELFYLFFLLPGLAEHGRPDLAEQMISDHYGYLMKFDDDTLPECFASVAESTGSRCHSWAGAAAIYAARYVLGIRQEIPGNPYRYIFDPITRNIQRASGRIAHADGWIEVSWERVNGSIQHTIRAPETVQITNQPK